MKMYGGAAIYIHVFFVFLPLYPWGKRRRYPLDKRLDGPRNRSGRREEENTVAPSGTCECFTEHRLPCASRTQVDVYRMLQEICSPFITRRDRKVAPDNTDVVCVNCYANSFSPVYVNPQVNILILTE
jgi:hypothetical protein